MRVSPGKFVIPLRGSGELVITVQPTEQLLQDFDRMQSHAVEVLTQHVGDSAQRRSIVLDEKQCPGPGFDNIDVAMLARFGGAKADRLAWKEFGQHIEFWSAVYCLRSILNIRTEGRKTEAELWRSAYEIGRMYTSMQTARAWAAGGMSSKSGAPKGTPRAAVSDEEITAAIQKAKGNATAAGKQVRMDAGSVRRRLRKMRTAKP